MTFLIAACSTIEYVPVVAKLEYDTNRLQEVPPPGKPVKSASGQYQNEDLVSYARGALDALRQANFIVRDTRLALDKINNESKKINTSP